MMIEEANAALIRLIEHANYVAEGCFADIGTVMPSWVGIGPRHPIMIPYAFDADLEEAQQEVTAIFAVEGVTHYIFTTQTVAFTEDITHLPVDEAMRHPSKLEVVLFQGEDEHGFFLADRKINRTGPKPVLDPLRIIGRTIATNWPSLLVPKERTLQ